MKRKHCPDCKREIGHGHTKWCPTGNKVNTQLGHRLVTYTRRTVECT